MNRRTGLSFACFTMLGLAALFTGGCATSRPMESWRFLQRRNPRVGIMPSGNLTAVAGAPIVVDKQWTEALSKAGFTVIDADRFVTYCSSRGIPVAKLGGVPTAQLGRDMGVDFLLTNTITTWGTKYLVIASGTAVGCETRLIEASTGAVVWSSLWTMAENSNSGSNGIAGMLANALVDAVVNSMFDRATQLAKQGIALQSSTFPYPGSAPATP